MDVKCTVRRAVPDDSLAIFTLIQELAAFEKAPLEVITTPETLINHGFGENPLFTCWVAEVNGNIAGMALCYVRYSTWKGPVLYLEDIIVAETYRQNGIGGLLFEQCMQYGRAMGYQRISWQVLEWNMPAIGFYKKYGATFDAEWLNCSINL